jgi:hypothetical protein
MGDRIVKISTRLLSPVFYNLETPRETLLPLAYEGAMVKAGIGINQRTNVTARWSDVRMDYGEKVKFVVRMALIRLELPDHPPQIFHGNLTYQSVKLVRVPTSACGMMDQKGGLQ